MKTIIVDDELWSMKQFEIECGEMQEVELIATFDRSVAALEFAKKHHVEFALLDIQMPEMDGITLGRELRKIYPGIVIVYVTGNPDHMLDALNAKADYYVLKPYTKEDIDDIVQRAELLSKRQGKKVFARTFGQFDIFINEQALRFSNAKAKELLALLIDRRGGALTSEQIVTYLWEDKTCDPVTLSYVRRAIKNLKEDLGKCNIAEILIDERNSKRIDVDKINCDYYELMKGNRDVISTYSGFYMSQYSWAEVTIPIIENKFKAYNI